jgi:hypothetical protein
VTGEQAVTMSEERTTDMGDCGDNSRQAEMNYTLVGKGWRVVRCETPTVHTPGA